MRKVAIWMLFLAATIGCSSSGESPTDNDVDYADADSIAVAWFIALGDTLSNIKDDLDAVDGDPDLAALRDYDFSALRAGFAQAIAVESDHALAHLGMAMVELAEANYDHDLWEAVDSLDVLIWDEDGDDPPLPPGRSPLHRRLLGNQFEILATAPACLAQRLATVPTNLSTPYFQDLIISSIIPRVDAAIAQMDIAETDADFELRYEFMDETVEVDFGEVYFFSASLRALRAGLLILTAYNLDAYDAAGTYDWMDQVETKIAIDYEVSEIDTTGILEVTYEVTDIKVALVRALKAQLTRPNSDFLSLRVTGEYAGGTSLAQAHADLEAMLQRLELMLAVINAEDPGDQIDDVIRIADLDDFYDEIQQCDDCPQFMRDWNDLQDMIDWTQDLLTGEITVVDQIQDVAFDITIDFGKFFNDPVQDWKALLPYHRWLADEDDYLTYNVDGPWGQNHDDSQPVVLTTATGEEVELMGIDLIYATTVYVYLEESPVEYLDRPEGGGAQVIDLHTELPYLPDYEFDGLFPTMTRARWEPSWLDLVN